MKANCIHSLLDGNLKKKKLNSQVQQGRKYLQKREALAFFFFLGEGSFSFTSTGFIPTSMMTAPGLIQLPLTMFACPTAEMIISACFMISSGLLVLE